MGGSSSKLDFDTKQFQISPAAQSDMCMSYSPNGVRVVKCEDLPEQYWGLKSFEAITRSASQSKSAGSEAMGDGEDTNGNEGGSGNQVVSELPAETAVKVPTEVPSDVSVELTPEPEPEPFKGYITHKGIGFHISFFDILFFAVIAYILFKLFK